MPYFVAPRLASPRIIEAYQGSQTDSVVQLANSSGSAASSVFTSGSALSSALWEGQNQQILAQPSVSWWTGTSPAQTGYTQGQVLLSVSAADLSTLNPGGEYQLQIYATTSGEKVTAAWCQLKVLPSPGFTSPAPPDLITYDACLAQLAVLNLTPAQQDILPVLITAASQAWRLECNDRYFDLRTLTEDHFVYLNGYLRLWQTPIQVITRVQGAPYQLALTVSNSDVQTAQAYFTYMGTDGGYAANAKTATGIYLNWVANGVPANQTFPYSTYPTIGQMASAINSYGSGWQAQGSTDLGQWLCSELVGGFVAQGCGQSSFPQNGAQFNVLSDLTIPQINPDSPMLWVGQQYGGNQMAQQWGPGGYEMFGGYSQNNGICRVTYTAGYSVIPAEIQYQVGQLVHWKLLLGIQDLLLKSEKAAEYQYEIALEMVANMPASIRQAAGRWKATYA